MIFNSVLKKAGTTKVTIATHYVVMDSNPADLQRVSAALMKGPK